MAQRYRIHNKSQSRLWVKPEDPEAEDHKVGPDRRAIVTARQLVAIQKSPLYKQHLITYERVGEEESQIGDLLGMDAKQLRAALKGIDDDQMLHELLVEAHARPAPAAVIDVIRKRLDNLEEADLTAEAAVKAAA